MDITLEEKSFILHSTAGAAMGLVSIFLPKQAAGILAIAVMYAVWVVFRQSMKLDPKTHGVKWWLGQGVYPFLTLWLFVWVLAYNFLRQ